MQIKNENAKAFMKKFDLHGLEILTDVEEKRKPRTKRGWIDIVGRASNIMFGLATEEEIQSIN